MKEQINSYFHFYLESYPKQAGAELCQAQVKIEIIVVIGVKVEFEIVIEVGIQLLAWVLGGRWVDGLKQK